jgi:hypothetical protein
VSIQLKVRVENVDRSGPVGAAVTLTPIAGFTDKGEIIFAGGTPAGKLLLEQLVPAAAAALEAGQEYAVQIVRIKSPEQASSDAAAESKPAEAETSGVATETQSPEGETKPADQQQG